MNKQSFPNQSDVIASLYCINNASQSLNNDFLWILVVNGQIELEINQKVFYLNNFDVVLLYPGDTYVITPKSHNLVLYIKIAYNFFCNSFADYSSIFCNSVEDKESNYDQIRNMLIELANTYFNQKNSLYLYSLLYKFMYYLHLNQFHTQDSEEQNKNDKFASRANNIMKYINANFQAPITLNDLASNSYLTPQYISKFIKKHLNMNFNEYLSKIRLEHAVKELMSSDNTVTNIAFNNGFPNMMAFNKAFKKRYGTTPLQYKKSNRQKCQRTESTDNTTGFIEVKYGDAKEYIQKFSNKLAEDDFSDNKIPAYKISIDVQDEKKILFLHTWTYALNIGFASDCLKSDFQYHLKMFQSNMKFKYARFQGIFNEDIIIKTDNASFNYSNVDKLIEFLYSLNLLPLIELGNKPKKISTGRTTKQFYWEESINYLYGEKGYTILEDFLKHCINRYGTSEVERWNFEIWVETDESLNSIIDADNYTEYFKNISGIIKSLLPNALVGGPGYNVTANNSFLEDMSLSFLKKGITPDFISIYLYPFEICNENSGNDKESILIFSTNKQWISNQITSIKSRIQKINPKIDRFYVTEWNSDFTTRNFINDTCFKAAYIVYNILDNYDKLNCFSYWPLSDITSDYKVTDSVLFGGNGLISKNGIKKPGYFAYQFLSMLGSKLIKKGDNYIVTTSSDGCYEVLTYNYKHINSNYCINYDKMTNLKDVFNAFENDISLDFEFRFQNLQNGKYRIKKYVLNEEHGSLLDEWSKFDFIKSLNQSDIYYLENICTPLQSISYMDCDNEMLINCHLLPHEVCLLIIKFEI